MKILQINPSAPNPVTHLSGYEPQHDYWYNVIVMVNAILQVTAKRGYDVKRMKGGADAIISIDVFPDGTHTATEWAEFVMALNHVLWLLHEAEGSDKYVDNMLQILNDLYYKWHDKALSTLKGKDLSTYLRITD